jgi:hypothetical protein
VFSLYFDFILYEFYNTNSYTGLFRMNLYILIHTKIIVLPIPTRRLVVQDIHASSMLFLPEKRVIRNRISRIV